ncbi:SGNH/GDSL hydrolase family protein [Puniceibacterium antarcticum]|uniref:SGNH/GDSL hydrolase family protein n=1 Tax=Puniceibacterium antarcticum TaxID=1206336 RepID=UPI00117BC3F3|nr:SGNH/GDSL hydrolase family protein [Puniceibacterium antarcticum]
MTDALDTRTTILEAESNDARPSVDTTAEGIAATSTGQEFRLVSNDLDVAFYRYRNEAGSAVLIETVPSVAALVAKADAADLASEIDVRSALIDSADGTEMVGFEDQNGYVQGYIQGDGSYDVLEVYFGTDGIRTPLYEVYDDGIEDGRVVHIDKFGVVLQEYPENPADASGGGSEPAVLTAQPNATYGLLRKLAGDQNANILVCSDSTGAGTDRWVYKISDAIAAWDGSVRVEYRAWDDSAKNYATAIVVYAGSGGATCTIWNAAVAGRQLYYLHGEHFDAAYGQTAADWLIINHGHNHDHNWTPEVHAAILIGGGQQIAMRHPYAGVSIVAQNPRLDNTQGTNRSLGAQFAARSMGWSLVDAFSLFQQAGKPPAWYDDDGTDPIHPSVIEGGGDDEIVQTLIAPLISNQISLSQARDPTLYDRVRNLLSNGLLSDWTASVPDDWELVNCTSAEETTIYETAAISARLTNNTATGAQLRQTMTGDKVRALRGRYVTAAFRAWIPTATTSGVAGTDIKSSSDGGATYGSSSRGWSVTNTNGRGGWLWMCQSALIPADATHIQISSPGQNIGAAMDIIIDRGILVPGSLPKDMEF